ncbi:MAG: MaoC family dehydratase [Ktedonobacteraceae bacterium]
MPDATPQFKQQLKEAFNAIQEGQVFTFRRTFSSGDVALFCGVTGDYNPYHIDQTFLEESWFKRPIIPGLLTASMITHIGGMIGFLASEMEFKFVSPVYVGDTITCIVTFDQRDEVKRKLRARATYINQNSEEVLQCKFSGFPANVRLAH